MSSKIRVVAYSLFELVYEKAVDGNSSNVVLSWLTPVEYAAMKRRKSWKLLIAVKKLSSVSITLKF